MNLLETLFGGVVDLSWRCSWVLLLFFALRPWLSRRIPARVVFALWIAVALRLLLPVAIPTAWSPFGRPVVIVASAETAGAVTVDDRAVTRVRAAELDNTDGAASTLSPRAADALRRVSLTSLLAGLWAAGVAALLLAQLWVRVRFARALRLTRSRPSPVLQRLVAEAAERAGLAGIGFSVTRAVPSPSLYGAFRPQLLVPPGFLEKLSPDELRFVIAHELAHARRRDLLANTLLHAAAIVHWFNPLVWFASRVARTDCELACDETVVDRLAAPERESYGATLLRTISLVSSAVPPPAALGVVESKRDLKRRLTMIVRPRMPARFVSLAGGALLAFALALSVTRPAHAERPSGGTNPAPTVRPVPAVAAESGTTDPDFARLNALFPNGVVATIDDRTITVAELRRELLPLIPQLRAQARDEAEFQKQLEVLQNEVTANLVTRFLVIKQFRQQLDAEKAKVIEPAEIDRRIDQEVRSRYGGDRAELLADLERRGTTWNDYRREVEEDLIYWYMRRQQQKLFPNTAKRTPAPEKAEATAPSAGVRKRQPAPLEPYTPAVRQPRS